MTPHVGIRREKTQQVSCIISPRRGVSCVSCFVSPSPKGQQSDNGKFRTWQAVILEFDRSNFAAIYRYVFSKKSVSHHYAELPRSWQLAYRKHSGLFCCFVYLLISVCELNQIPAVYKVELILDCFNSVYRLHGDELHCHSRHLQCDRGDVLRWVAFSTPCGIEIPVFN